MPLQVGARVLEALVLLLDHSSAEVLYRWAGLQKALGLAVVPRTQSWHSHVYA